MLKRCLVLSETLNSIKIFSLYIFMVSVEKHYHLTYKAERPSEAFLGIYV